MRKSIALLLSLVLLLSLAPRVRAEAGMTATNISGTGCVAGSTGFKHISYLFDGDRYSAYPVQCEASLTLKNKAGIGSLYFLFDELCGTYTVTCGETGRTAQLGTNGFLHEYADLVALLGHAPKELTIRFPNGVDMSELYVFTEGQVPDYVQKWEAPAEGSADLVLFSTHGDDEQLFFAGILPYYAGQLGLNVQVVYLVGHQNSFPNRMHEMLTGLYAVGVRNYPVFGTFPDQFSATLEDGYRYLANAGYSRESLLEFVVENLRRFKPLVAIGHDIYGEYGHGQHMVYTDVLMEAVTLSADDTRFPASLQRWGTWDTPKTYLHLYPENPIVLDWDQPLSRFDGMTAFEVTRDIGFPCHKSQYSDFLWYLIQAPTAAGFTQFSPCQYGLYRSTVGEDADKNEFFENLSGYIRPKTQRKKAALPPLPGKEGCMVLK